MELLDCVAAKFYEEPGVFKLLVSDMWCMCLLFLECAWSISCVKWWGCACVPNKLDSGLDHGFVPSGFQWTRRISRSTAETGSDALPAAEDIRR